MFGVWFAASFNESNCDNNMKKCAQVLQNFPSQIIYLLCIGKARSPLLASKYDQESEISNKILPAVITRFASAD